MVIAILADIQNTEEFLGNFTEAEFDLKHVSVIMKNTADRNKIADDLGPLKGVGINNLAVKLSSFKLSKEKINQYINELNNNKVFVAIDSYPDQSVVSMLNDYHPQFLQII